MEGGVDERAEVLPEGVAIGGGGRFRASGTNFQSQFARWLGGRQCVSTNDPLSTTTALDSSPKSWNSMPAHQIGTGEYRSRADRVDERSEREPESEGLPVNGAAHAQQADPTVARDPCVHLRSLPEEQMPESPVPGEDGNFAR
jgi:hypothetical protein